jgi:predicted SnoaL-like aldol condensation-catalyzing enzyme
MIDNKDTRQICEEFSKGNFEFAYNYLAQDIQWNIVGHELLTGKDQVVEFCNKTSEYFKEVTTEFRTSNIIVDSNLVAISGTAVFIKNENKRTEVSSCDVYRFEDGMLIEITSYCIVTSKDKD